MAVLKAPPKQAKTAVVQLRLDDEAKTKLAKYEEFLDCSPSYVVMEALKLVYNKDKEFQAWLSGEHPSNHLQSSKDAASESERIMGRRAADRSRGNRKIRAKNLAQTDAAQLRCHGD